MKKFEKLCVECSEIFQDFTVMNDVTTTIYQQTKIPKNMQGMCFLVIDQVLVAKYTEPPTEQKEVLLQVVECIFRVLFLTPAKSQALVGGYNSTEDAWLYESFFDFLDITNSFIKSENM